MNRSQLNYLVAAALFAGTPPALAAGKVTKIEPSASNVTLQGGRATVKFSVHGDVGPTDTCGYFVEYGDGSAGDSRVIGDKEGRFPRSHERTFTRPGNYVVRAKGQRVKTTFGCDGDVSTAVNVVAAAAPAQAPGKRVAGPAATASSCPQGWVLNERSVNPGTGAFTCSPQPPAQKIACGPGLNYFEKGGMIGCRKGK